MIIKIFSRFYPVIPLWNHPKSLIKDLETKLEFAAHDDISISQPTFYVEKGKDPQNNPIKEDLSVKMPGFISPEIMNEEGYFTQKAKKQLEELKKKGVDNPAVTNPEKKE